MHAVLLLALAVHDQVVLDELETQRFRDFALALFDEVVFELIDPPTLHADDVIVMMAAFQLEHGMAAFEMVAGNQAGSLELREHPIDRGQTDVFAAIHQAPIDFFSRQMTGRTVLKHLDDLQTRQRHLQSRIAEILRFQEFSFGRE